MLHQMIGSVRAGTFHPDETRSGIFQSPQTSEVQLREDDVPVPEGRENSAYVVTPTDEQHEETECDVADPYDPSFVEDEFELVKDVAAVPDLPQELDDDQQELSGEKQIDSLADDSDSGSSDSSSSSLAGSDDDIFGVIHGGPAEPQIGKSIVWFISMSSQKHCTFFPKMTTTTCFFAVARVVMPTGCSTTPSFKIVGSACSVKSKSQSVLSRRPLLPWTGL